MTDNVIDLNEYRRRHGLPTVDNRHGGNMIGGNRQRATNVDPSTGQCVQIFGFNPDEGDELCITRLVYNEPSVLDSYYAMYPEQVIVVRYDECGTVCVRSAHTLEPIIDVVKYGDRWYAQVVENVDT